MIIARHEDSKFMTLAFADELCEKFPELSIVVYDGKEVHFIWENEKAASAENTDDF